MKSISESFSQIKKELSDKNCIIGSKIELRKANNGHGLFCKSGFAENEIIMEIPTRATIKAETVEQLGCAQIEFDFNDTDLLALSILKMKRSGEMNEYFNCMEHSQLPFEMSDKEINSMPNQCKYEAIKHKSAITLLEWQINQHMPGILVK